MKKILPAILLLVFLAAGSPASARKQQPSLKTDGITLEPLTWLDYKHPSGMVSDGRYAYIQSSVDPGAVDPGNEVMVVDCINPAHPIQIASIPLDAYWGVMGVTKNTLYISADQDILIYDVTDPHNPELVNVYAPAGGMRVFGMVIVGDIAYLSGSDPAYLRSSALAYPGSSSGLVILDISDPVHPFLLGANSDEYMIGVSLVQPPYLYAQAPGKLLIYDISNPAQPILLGRYYEDMERWGGPVAVMGDLAYLAGSLRDFNYQIIGYFTDIIDISDPSQPVRVGNLPQLAVPIMQLIERDGVLYAFREDGLATYTLADPYDPQSLGVYPSNWGTDVELQGNQALLLDYITGLHILDVTDPAHPSRVGFYGWSQGADYMTSSGTNLYTIGNFSVWYPEFGYKSVLRIIDSTDPFNDRLTGYIVLDGTALGKPFVDGSFVYIPTDRGVEIVDASDPANLQYVARAGVSYTSAVEVMDGVAYTYSKDIGSGATLSIMDVSNPASPALLGQSPVYYDTGDMSIARQGDRIYAYLITNGQLVVLDVTDPADPFVVQGDMAGGPYTLIDTESRGSQTITYLYGGNADFGEMGITALDTSDPEHMVLLSFIPINSSYTYEPAVLESQDGILYFTCFSVYICNGLVIFDFNDPTQPRQVASASDPNGTILDASMEGKYIFTTAGGPITVYAKISDLSGQVTDHNYQPFPGVSLALNNGEATLSDAEGLFAFKDLTSGTYAITPTLQGYAFSPPSWRVNLPNADLFQNFVILPSPVSVVLQPGITTTLTYPDVQGLPTSFNFPAGLVDAPATAIVTPTLEAGFFSVDFTGHAFELALQAGGEPVYSTTFPAPVSIAIQYSPLDTAVISDTASLALYWMEDGIWEKADDSCIIPSSLTVQEPGIFRGVICREGQYALFGPTHAVALPQVSYGSDTSEVILPFLH